jgi:putative transposase
MAINTTRRSSSTRSSSPSTRNGSRKPPRLRKPRRRRRARVGRRTKQSSKFEKGRTKRRIDAAKQKKAARKIRNAYQVLKENVFPLMAKKEIDAKGYELGFAQREAKAIRPFEFVLSCVLATTVEAKRGFAAVWRVFGAATGQQTARSAITQRFGEGSSNLMRAVFEKALERLPDESHPELLGKLEQFESVLAHDGSVLALSPLLNKLFPATRTNSVAAAAKLHATADLVHRKIIAVEVTGERHSELEVAWDEPAVVGALYIDDLGYYSHDYLAVTVDAGAHVLSRLKASSKPTVVEVYHGVRSPKASVGMEFKDIVFTKSHSSFDLKARFSTKWNGPRDFRIVGVYNEETGDYHCYVTDLPPEDFSAEEIADLYSQRWIIELLFKLLKSFCHLDHVDTKDPNALRTHIYASLIASTVLHALLVSSAQAAGIHPSDISQLTVAAAAPLIAMPLLILWLDIELTRERLSQMLLQIIVYGCREQNPGRRRRRLHRLSGES